MALHQNIDGIEVYLTAEQEAAVRKEWADEAGASRFQFIAAISDRQFAQQLAILGTITQGEAMAWAARGDLPEVLETAISALPAEGGQQFFARMLLSSATTYERQHPLAATLGALLGYDDAELDDLWRSAAAL